MKIGMITGAAGGIGREFLKCLAEDPDRPDEIWAVGRNEEKLQALQKQYGPFLRPVAADLGDPRQLGELLQKIESTDAEISLLINSAGLARMAPCRDFSGEEISAAIDVNCKAMTLLCNACIPKMRPGARILNLSSASAFQPNPYIALYAASKVFVKNYSRALHYELKDWGITCTAVCPGWVDTDMLDREKNGKPIRFPGMVSPQRVARQALRDSRKGRSMSVCSLFVKYEHIMSKLLPNAWIMKIWAKEVEKYL